MPALGNSESVRKGNAKEARPSRTAPARETAEAPPKETAERSAEKARAAAQKPEATPKERFKARLKASRADLDDAALDALWEDIGYQSPEGIERRDQGRKLSDR